MHSKANSPALQGVSDDSTRRNSHPHSVQGLAGRRKGKGVTGASSTEQFDADVLRGSHTVTHHRMTGMHTRPPTKSQEVILLPIDNFSVSVCSKGCKPTTVQVRSGTTVGQLSQAEEGFSSFAQPIAVTTLTGFPFPLNSQLTPSTWYVIANGATHSIPKCPEVHACQSTVLTLQGQSRFQGLLVQGPLVAVDETQFYVQLVRSQGHQVPDPIELQDFTDIDQATWALQSLRAPIDRRESNIVAAVRSSQHCPTTSH